MSRLGRWSALTTALATVLVAGLLAGAYTLVTTERGTRWLVDLALARAGGTVDYSRLEGTLAGGVTVHEIAWHRNGQSIRFERIHGAWNLWDLLGGQLRVKELVLANGAIVVPAGEDNAAPETASAWPSLALPFPVLIERALVDRLAITLGDDRRVVDRLELRGSAGPLHLRLEKLAVAAPEGRVEISGRIGNRFPYPLKLKLDWSLAIPDATVYTGGGRLSGNLKILQLDQRLESPFTAKLSGRLRTRLKASSMEVLPAAMGADLEASWQDVPLPPGAGDAVLVAETGRATLEGGWQDFTFTLDNRLTRTPGSQPPLLLSASGTGRRQQLFLEAFELRLASGKVTGEGEIDWQMPVNWRLRAVIEDLALGDYLPRWPATLKGRLSSQGAWQSGEYSVRLQLAELKGRIHDRTIDGSGLITVTTGLGRVDDLTLRVGENRLQVDGTVADGQELKWQLAAPTLSAIHGDLSGSLHASGTLRGTWSDLEVRLRAEGRRLGLAEWSTDDLNLALERDLGGHYRVALDGRDLARAGLIASELALRGKGTLEDHNLDLAVAVKGVVADAGLKGGLTGGQRWRGNLASLQVEDIAAGTWRLEQATALELAADRLALAPFCLTGGSDGGGSLCGRATLVTGELEAQAEVAGLPLVRLNPLLPPGSRLDGLAEGSARLSGPLTNLEGRFQLATRDLVLEFQPAGDESPITRPATLTLEGTLTSRDVAGSGVFRIADVGLLDLDFRAGQPLVDAPLSGSLRGGFDQLRWLDGLFAELDKPEGTLAVDLALSGRTSAPVLAGRLTLGDARVQIPAAGIQLENGRGNITFDPGGSWQLDLSVDSRSGGSGSGDPGLNESGRGTLNLAGSGRNFLPARLEGNLELTGDNFRLLDRPDLNARVSPSLDIGIRPDAIEIDGRLEINEGRLEIRQSSTQAIAVSPDEEIYPADRRPANGSRRQINVDIGLHLGDSFRFAGYGLTGRLAGDLQVSQRGNSPTRALGTIEIHDGVYKAYGQKLEIREGLLVFQGPVTNPGLDITAVRSTPYATAGVVIGGTPGDLNSEIFSDPELPPTEAMAVLITGKPLSSATQSDANRIANAAASLGISRSAWITNKLRDSFGIDVLTLQGGEAYTESSLLVGKYLTPRLFIGYVQNLFTPQGAVELEYDLTDNLGLEARSGETQSIDLMFKIEH